eukprot:3047290-Rhodomonas_salina.1
MSWSSTNSSSIDATRFSIWSLAGLDEVDTSASASASASSAAAGTGVSSLSDVVDGLSALSDDTGACTEARGRPGDRRAADAPPPVRRLGHRADARRAREEDALAPPVCRVPWEAAASQRLFFPGLSMLCSCAVASEISICAICALRFSLVASSMCSFLYRFRGLDVAGEDPPTSARPCVGPRNESAVETSFCSGDNTVG